MNSIMTNSAAMTALQSLNATNKQLEMTQSRVSTGYRVATAADNAAYFSIATTMRSDRGALSAVEDALGLGAATVDVATTGLESAIDVVDEIKNKLNDLALKGMSDWDNYGPGQRTIQQDLPIRSHRKASHGKSIQLKLFEK